MGDVGHGPAVCSQHTHTTHMFSAAEHKGCQEHPTVQIHQSICLPLCEVHASERFRSSMRAPTIPPNPISTLPVANQACVRPSHTTCTALTDFRELCMVETAFLWREPHVAIQCDQEQGHGCHIQDLRQGRRGSGIHEGHGQVAT